MASDDELRASLAKLGELANALADALADASLTLGKVVAALGELAGETPPAQPDVTFALGAITSAAIRVTWETDEKVEAWRVSRSGSDTKGSGPWSGVVVDSQRDFTFQSLQAGTPYTLKLEPVLSTGVGNALTLTATTSAAPVQPSSGDHGPRAVASGWKERARDDFNGTGVDTKLWGIYNSAGHGNKGLRRPDAFSIVADPTALGGRCLRVAGDANGKTGGMAFQPASQRFGRWAARMRVPRGDAHYHPVLLTWPDAENWPTGGEIDFAEGNCSSNKMQFFLHYSKNNNQTSNEVTIDVTQWHWYEMEWSPTGVRGWCDGNLYFEDTNQSHFNYDGFGPHHGTIQLDWFPDNNRTTGTGEMYVDAYRVYSI